MEKLQRTTISRRIAGPSDTTMRLTQGLRLIVGALMVFGALAKAPLPAAEETAEARPAFAPGAKRSYDNGGWRLLGHLVEKVSGQSYGDSLREKFFEPLGMTNPGVYRATLS